jgi:flagellar basal-body rod modification protein FlgD
MTVMSVSNAYSQASTPVTQDNAVMGKDDFLTLLVAQLQHQDPLNPSESTEFTAQLAQFSSLEQLQNIGDTLHGFEVYQSTLNNIQASEFIGKTVTAEGNLVRVAGEVADPIRFDLSQDADAVYVQIYDEYGEFVADLSYGAMQAGEQQVTWEAEDADGQTLTDGMYTYAIMAANEDGSVVDSTSYLTGVITGVDYKDGLANLLMGEKEIPISAVIRVEDVQGFENI